MFNRKSVKFLIWFGVLLCAGFLVIAYSSYFSQEVREKRVILKYFENLEEEYKNDTYGGATPEETLALFIAALEAGDIDLASKYFLPDEREKMSNDLKEEYEVEKNLNYFINGLRQLKQTGETKDEKAFFILIGSDNVVANQVVFTRNQNGVWKITEL